MSLFLNLAVALGDSFTLQFLYLWKEEPPGPVAYEVGWVPESVNDVSCSCSESNPILPLSVKYLDNLNL
jgi:hypothetical protein